MERAEDGLGVEHASQLKSDEFATGSTRYSGTVYGSRTRVLAEATVSDGVANQGGTAKSTFLRP